MQNVVDRRAFELFKGHGSVNATTSMIGLKPKSKLCVRIGTIWGNPPRPSSLRPNCRALLQPVTQRQC